MTDLKPLGLVDGSTEATTRRFHMVLDEDQVAQLDQLVATTQTLPGGERLTHYGIVVEGKGVIEGAEMASDTQRIAGTKTMPGVVSRRVEVQILRTVPELWLAALPGSPVVPARGIDRERALFLDQMDQPLAVGLDQAGEPVFADFAFVNGEKGGHVSISGISGVATKTSYALFLLYMLFETKEGRKLLGSQAPSTRALVFNVKGEDLLHLDRDNLKFATRPEAIAGWRSLGVEDPGRFRDVRLAAPRSYAAKPGVLATDVTSRDLKSVRPFGWSPAAFIRQGLLRFCFSDIDDARNQISFIEQRVRVQLARWAWPLDNEPGAVVLAPPPEGTSFNMARVIEQKRAPKKAGEGAPFRDFSDLVDFLTARLAPEDEGSGDPTWTANVQGGTVTAFLRRLYAQLPRIGHLVAAGVPELHLETAVTVVDIHSLHEDGQRFVVGALLYEIFEAKQGTGREPLRFIVLDELNKYAPRQGTSPIKELLIDIAARGRSLGVLLIGAQQSAGDVDPAIIRNASLKIVGRLDAGESEAYRFLSPEVRERAERFLPGTMVLDQPLIPAPLPIRFPFPAFATCVAEGGTGAPPPGSARERELFGKLS